MAARGPGGSGYPLHSRSAREAVYALAERAPEALPSRRRLLPPAEPAAAAATAPVAVSAAGGWYNSKLAAGVGFRRLNQRTACDAVCSPPSVSHCEVSRLGAPGGVDGDSSTTRTPDSSARLRSWSQGNSGPVPLRYANKDRTSAGTICPTRRLPWSVREHRGAQWRASSQAASCEAGAARKQGWRKLPCESLDKNFFRTFPPGGGSRTSELTAAASSAAAMAAFTAADVQDRFPQGAFCSKVNESGLGEAATQAIKWQQFMFGLACTIRQLGFALLLCCIAEATPNSGRGERLLAGSNAPRLQLANPTFKQKRNISLQSSICAIPCFLSRSSKLPTSAPAQRQSA